MTSLIKSLTASLLLTTCLTVSAHAEISADMKAMLRMAATQGDQKILSTLTDYAIKINPDQAEEIRTFVASVNPVTVETAVMGNPETPSVTTSVISREAAPESKIHYGYFNLRGWDGDVELNLLNSSGNTQNTSIGLGGKLGRETGKFHHLITGFFDFNKNTGIKDKQKWGLGYKLDMDISERSYVSAFGGYDNDQFGPFRERFTLSAGYGYHLIQSDDVSLSLEGGPSVLLTKELAGEAYLSELTAFASSHFVWDINKRSKLENDTGLFIGARNVLDSKSALTVKINGALSSKFSFDILYDKDAPLGRKKTDTVARAGLLYDF